MISFKGQKILIVDDVEADRMLLSTYLQSLGCRIYFSRDGMDAIHKAKLLKPSLILMDQDMPRCDGYAACKILASNVETSEIPVIFISGYFETRHRIKGLLSGAVDYIGKPYDFNEVQLRLSVHLEGRGTSDEPEISSAEAYCQKEALDKILFHSTRVHLVKCLSNPPGIEELAKLVGTNKKRLNQAFKHCAGVTVFEYLREERMKESSHLLSQTNLSVTEIADLMGFSSGANFATAFKERYGVAPSRFRQKAPPSVVSGDT